jgi:hypothetical protein
MLTLASQNGMRNAGPARKSSATSAAFLSYLPRQPESPECSLRTGLSVLLRERAKV